ncbi:TERF1-interacting nuclear factor 2 [Aulostomus maculatus]
MRKYVKITETVVSFHRLVQTLLRDPEAREEFFKEKFLVDYGATFDQELEKLMWEFLIRLDQLLPVPSLSQTVSWLSAAPPVLEVCAQAATQPQLLKILLQHETCLGHLESAASLPPNMGDSILASLSLPPSGKVSSNQVTGPGKCSVGQSDCPHRHKPPFIAPVIGLISNEDVPFMNSAGKNNQRGDAPAGAREAMHTHLSPKCFTGVKELQVKGRSSGVKRKQPAEGGNTSDEEDAVLTRSGMPSGGRSHADLPTQLLCRMDTSLQSMFASYLKSQPSVVIEKLSAANWPGRGGKSPSVPQQSHRRKTPVGTPLT